MKTCPHCAETDLQDDATVCKHCGREIGLAADIRDAGETMKAIGCLLTLAVTVPVLILVMLGAC